MNLSLFIARRYLFAPKKRNAINIISMISMIGVAVGTMALIVVLSVFNGIDMLLQDAGKSFTPDLVVIPAEGKFMDADSAFLKKLTGMPEVRYCHPVVEETALAKAGEKLVPVTVKGVYADYARHTGIADNLLAGSFTLEEEGKPAVVLGVGIYSFLGNIRLGSATPVTLYYPDRTASSANASAINQIQVLPTGIFGTQQDLDSKYLFTGIEPARELFDAPGKISRIELVLREPGQLVLSKKQISGALTPDYKIVDKYDLNRSFYAMMKSEKLAIFLILIFILCIASFNIIGSISMLIIDKREDIGIYEALGLTWKNLVSIFAIEGNLITGTGALIGLVLGIGICWIQKTFGLITLGNGSYMIEAYPVKLVGSDIALIMGVVLVIGAIATYFPVRYLIRRTVKKH